MLVAPDVAAGRLVRLTRGEIRSPFSYWLVRPAGRHDALVDLFKEWLLEHLFAQGGLVAGGTA